MPYGVRLYARGRSVEERFVSAAAEQHTYLTTRTWRCFLNSRRFSHGTAALNAVRPADLDSPCSREASKASTTVAASSVESEMEKSPIFKRRKLRKGTNSCWECKRRKIRCTFANPNDSICDSCRSRGTGCISQAFQNNAEVVTNNSARLNRIEAAIAQLKRRAGTDTVLEYDTQGAAAKTIASVFEG